MIIGSVLQRSTVSLYGARGSLTVRTPRGSVGNISADHINAFRSLPPSPSFPRRDGPLSSQGDIISVNKTTQVQPQPPADVEPESGKYNLMIRGCVSFILMAHFIVKKKPD